jgi:hypothetical protein
MLSSVMLRRVALVGTDVLEGSIATIIRMRKICYKETTLAVSSNRILLQRNTNCVFRLVINAILLNFGSYKSHTV